MSVRMEGWPKASAVDVAMEKLRQEHEAKLVQDLAESIIAEFKHHQFDGGVILRPT